MPKIYLSPSFQDHNVGVGDFGTEERRCNEIADVVERELKKSDKFVVIRNKPEMSLLDVIRDSNKNNPDVHFSIHTNAGANNARGCEVYAYKPNTEGDRLAKIVYRNLSAITPTEDRGVKYNSLAETTQTKAIAVLTEVAFHSNKEDAEWMINNIENIGKALALSLYEFYGIEYKESVEPRPIEEGYTYKDFVIDIQKAEGQTGKWIDGIAGKRTLELTPTISKYKNNKNACVKPVQKYLYVLGYTEVGNADGIAGVKFETAVKHYQKNNGCYVDGELTAKNKTWKSLLQI